MEWSDLGELHEFMPRPSLDDEIEMLLSSSPVEDFHRPQQNTPQMGDERSSAFNHGSESMLDGDRTEQEPTEQEQEEEEDPPTPTPQERKTEVVRFEPDQDDGPNELFVKEDVAAVPSEESGLLSRMIGPGASDPLEGMDGPRTEIRVFMAQQPKGEGWMKLVIPEEADLDTTIAVLLKQYAKEGRQPPLGHTVSDFELNIADEEGEIDDDYPALSRERPIGHFSAIASTFMVQRLNSAAAAENQEDEKEGWLAFKKLKNRFGHLFLRVHLPDNQSIVLNVAPDLLIKDLLLLISNKETNRKGLHGHGIDGPNVAFIHPDKHIIELCDDDENKTKEALDMNRTIQSLKTDEIKVVAKKYADAPQENPAGQAKSSRNSGKARALADDSDYLFNEVTASKYKEYDVIKINKRGVRQERILGIDRERMYNMPRRQKSGSVQVANLKNVLGSGGVKKPSRLISDIRKVERTEEGPPTGFQIHVVEDDQYNQNVYEASSAHEAAEIVAKLKFLLTLYEKPHQHRP